MNIAGLIVAGGAGDRMVKSGETRPKPLVSIHGATLLERNVCALLRARLLDIYVAVSAKSESVVGFAQGRCRKIAEILGASLSVIVEETPLGSIGAAAFIRNRDAVIVVNADNLTNLDLRAMLGAHEVGDALTLAIHEHSVAIPFGVVTTEEDRVVAYHEKPNLTTQICSAVSVLGEDALASLVPGETIGLPALTSRLLARGTRVRAYLHDALWVDVNDKAAIEQAETMVAAYPEEFILWPDPYQRRMLEEILSVEP